MTPPHPRDMIVMSVKCEEPIDELTVQVLLLYHHPNFKYCTLLVSGTELRSDRQTNDPITRCPRRTFRAGGIKINKYMKMSACNNSVTSIAISAVLVPNILNCGFQVLYISFPVPTGVLAPPFTTGSLSIGSSVGRLHSRWRPRPSPLPVMSAASLVLLAVRLTVCDVVPFATMYSPPWTPNRKFHVVSGSDGRTSGTVALVPSPGEAIHPATESGWRKELKRKQSRSIYYLNLLQ